MAARADDQSFRRHEKPPVALASHAKAYRERSSSTSERSARLRLRPARRARVANLRGDVGERHVKGESSGRSDLALRDNSRPPWTALRTASAMSAGAASGASSPRACIRDEPLLDPPAPNLEPVVDRRPRALGAARQLIDERAERAAGPPVERQNGVAPAAHRRERIRAPRAAARGRPARAQPATPPLRAAVRSCRRSNGRAATCSRRSPPSRRRGSSRRRRASARGRPPPRRCAAASPRHAPSGACPCFAFAS